MEKQIEDYKDYESPVEVAKKYNGRKGNKEEVAKFFSDNYMMDHSFPSIKSLILSLLKDQDEIEISVDDYNNFNLHVNGHELFVYLTFTNNFDPSACLSIMYDMPLSKLDDLSKYREEAKMELGAFHSETSIYFYKNEIRSFNAFVQPHTYWDSKYYIEGGKFGGTISNVETRGPEKHERTARIGDFMSEIPEIMKGLVKPQLPLTYENEALESLLIKYNAEREITSIDNRPSKSR